MSPEEKRRYPRLALRIEDGFFGNFRLPDAQFLVAPIVNLSAGGLNMAVKSSAGSQLAAGLTLLLNHIVGGTQLTFLTDIQSEIRWIKSLGKPDYLSVGCQFKNLAPAVHQQLIRFVDSERMARGQYD